MTGRKRPWVMRVGLFVALGALLGLALPARAAQTSATLAPGALTMTPTLVALSYDAPANSAHVYFTSSFTVVVTDATGSRDGWQIRGATASMSGPSGAVAADAFAIIDFSVAAAAGTWPNPICVCDSVHTTLATILQTPARTGVGKATITFTTQFALPDDAPRGHYSVALLLEVGPLAQATSAPSGGRGSGSANPGTSPNPGPRPPLAAGGVPPAAPVPALAPTRRPELPTPGQPDAVSIESGTIPAPESSGGATNTGAPPAHTALVADPATTTPTAASTPIVPAAVAEIAPTGTTAAPARPPNRAVTSAGGTDAANVPQSGASASQAHPAAAQPAPRNPATAQDAASGIAALLSPATVRTPTRTHDGAMTVLHSSVTVGQGDARRGSGWRLQATLRAPGDTRSAMQAVEGIALDVAALDTGGAPIRTLAYTLSALDPSGALLDLAIPAGAAPTTLLLAIHLLLDDVGAALPPATLTITLIAGP